MTLILNNEEIRQALTIKDSLDALEETYRELAQSSAVNCPISQTYLPHSLPQTSYSPDAEHRRKFAAEMERENEIPTEPVESAETAVADADIVCSATNSSRPVVRAEWLQPGMHYNSIREFEMDEASLEKCDVVA